MSILKTERLVVREFTLDDAPFIVELLNEPSFIRYIADKGVRTLQDAREYLAGGPLASYRDHGYGLWAVVLRGDGTTVGLCGLVRRESLPHPDIGFAFLKHYRRHGFALEAAAAVLAHGRDTLGLEQIVAITSLDNERSARLLEKLGLRSSGTVQLDDKQGSSRFYA